MDGIEPTICAGNVFSDVTPANPFCPHIERLRALNITNGFGDGTYRPKNILSRAQMSAFIVRAVDGVDPAICTGNVFSDVTSGNAFCAHIERLQALNITQGCGAGNFCPNGLVTRAQMAVFLARAFLGMP